MTHIHTTRQALIQRERWRDLIEHVLAHGELRSGWLSAHPDLDALAVTEVGAQLAELEGLGCTRLVALGYDPARVKAASEGFVPGPDDLCARRLRQVCAVRPRTSHPQG